MKQATILLSLLILTMVFSSVSFAKSYQCYRYVDGDPVGSYVNITADNETEAEKKAMKKFKKLGGPVTSANCSIKI